jgi:thymidylate synthase
MIKNQVGTVPNQNNEEQQYLGLIRDILSRGSLEVGRNGNTISIFGAAMHFSLENNKIPILTSKKVAWKTCLKELLWFIKGKTDNTLLQYQGVHIWDANASRNFLDDRGLTNLKENDLGPVYGHQWRHFNAPYTNCDTDYTGQGVDQLQYIIDALKDPVKRFSRRLVMSAWNPCQIDEMALPPCHVLCQFNVSHGNKLSCALYQRSGDIGLGVPFNIASYSFLTHILAKHCELEAYEFIYTLGNCHIYDDHIGALKEQLEKPTFEFPTIQINQVYENINDYSINNIEVQNYKFSDSIFMKMRA